MLKKITYYYLYKVCWFYKEKLKADHSYYYAVLWFFSAVNFIVLTLTTLALMALGVEWNSNWVRGISAVIILSGFPLTKSYNYQELVEKYKYEKHRSLKGWLVFLSMIGTFIIWMKMCWIYSSWIHNS